MDFGYILKVLEFIGLVDGLYLGYEWKREIRNDFKIFVLRIWKDGIIINRDEKSSGRVGLGEIRS